MNILVKSLINGIITFFVVGLAVSLMKGIAFVQVVTTPYYLSLVCFAVVGSYIGFTMKEAKEEKQE